MQGSSLYRTIKGLAVQQEKSTFFEYALLYGIKQRKKSL